jgi:hypothetical protein
MAAGSRKTNVALWRPSVAGWVISVAIHALVLVLLAISLLPRESGASRIITSSFGSSDATATASSIVDGEDIRGVKTVEQITGQMVERRIRDLLSRQEPRSNEEKLSQLDKATQRLSRLSTDESLDELAGTFRDWLALSPRAVHPVAAAAEGEFDFDSAQVHDVWRQVDESGQVTYVAVLLDAAGRTHEMTLEEDQGGPLFEIMQRVKANPLLEKIYRQILMPLLDRLVHDKEANKDLEATELETPVGTEEPAADEAATVPAVPEK